MYISSNEVPSQSQLAVGGVVYKLYIHTQALEFYQCGTTPLSYSNNKNMTFGLFRGEGIL